MSELINNSEKRKELLKHMILQLHAGEAPDLVRQRLIEILKSIPYDEVVEVEQELIAEGLPVTEVQKLCDLHVAVFQSGLESEPAPENKPGHPLFDFRTENELIARTIESIQGFVHRYADGEFGMLEQLRQNAKNLSIVLNHYDNKENMIFPILEKHGFAGQMQVMWGVDNDIRSEIKKFTTLLEPQKPLVISVENAFAEVARKVIDMIYKEEKVLIPETLSFFTPEDWQQMADEIAGKVARAPVSYSYEPEVSTSVPSGLIPLQTGALSAEQIDLLLTNLPVDITFVDENNEVRYFSQGKERIFTRTAAIIGRKVQNCHPPQSVHVVQKIVEDFKAGRRDVAEFWIQMGEAFVHIRYFALRDENGAYKGVIEVPQNVAGIRALEGEKRLLD